MKKKLVGVISLFCCVVLQVSAQQKNPFGPYFGNCNKAFEVACQDVKNDSMKYFMLPYGYDGLPDIYNKGEKIDSILLNTYNIRVSRKNVSWDYTLRCYSEFITNHMDTIYNHQFYYKTINVVERMFNHTDTIPEHLVYKNRVEEPEE